MKEEGGQGKDSDEKKNAEKMRDGKEIMWERKYTCAQD